MAEHKRWIDMNFNFNTQKQVSNDDQEPQKLTRKCMFTCFNLSFYSRLNNSRLTLQIIGCILQIYVVIYIYP
jgi:hypothetical protein